MRGVLCAVDAPLAARAVYGKPLGRHRSSKIAAAPIRNPSDDPACIFPAAHVVELDDRCARRRVLPDKIFDKVFRGPGAGFFGLTLGLKSSGASTPARRTDTVTC